MKGYKINYHFCVKSAQDTAKQILAICRNVACIDIDKSKVLKDVNAECKLEELESRCKDLYDMRENELLHKCQYLETKWTKCRHMVDQVVEQLGLSNLVGEYHTYCKLQILSINELCENGEIWLDGNLSADELFVKFMVQAIKFLVLLKLECLIGKGHYKFERYNKVALVLDIAIDAIFANTSLANICKEPSYQYFYTMKLNGVNAMEQFRQLYRLIPINDFLNKVYEFVYHNHKILLNFKNYLY